VLHVIESGYGVVEVQECGLMLLSTLCRVCLSSSLSKEESIENIMRVCVPLLIMPTSSSRCVVLAAQVLLECARSLSSSPVITSIHSSQQQQQPTPLLSLLSLLPVAFLRLITQSDIVDDSHHTHKLSLFHFIPHLIRLSFDSCPTPLLINFASRLLHLTFSVLSTLHGKSFDVISFSLSLYILMC
jgi:hypothetical protein